MEKLIDQQTEGVLKEFFQKELVREVDVKVYSDYESDMGKFTKQFLSELSEINTKIKPFFHTKTEGEKLGFSTDPFLVIGENLGYNIHYNGTPAGHEANTLMETIKYASQGKAGLSQETELQLKKLDKPLKLQVFVTTACPYCPQAAVLANRMAIENPGFITVETVEAQENQELSNRFNVSSVPLQVINEDIESSFTGLQPESLLVEEVLKAGASNYEEIAKELEAKKAESMKLIDNPAGVVHLSDATFEEAIQKYPNLVVDFWAEWCAPCRMMSPIIDSLAKDYSGRVVYAKLNTDENPVTSAEHKVESIPCILVFQNGKLVDRLVGARPKDKLEKDVAGLLHLISLA